MLRILIVENDRLFIQDLQMALKKYEVKVVGVATEATSAIALLDTELPDIALVDIELDNGSIGIEVAKHIQQHHQIPFIYLTDFVGSSNKYFKKAVDTNPTHYLPKGSFLPHQIWHFIETAMDNYSKQQQPEADELVATNCFIRHSFFARDKEDYAYHKVTVRDLKSIDVTRPYIKISTMHDAHYLSKHSLAHALAAFASPNLLQINQSCAVHIQIVVSINKNNQTVILLDGTSRKLSREYSKEVQERLLLLP